MNNKGFTTIELLVSFIIISFISVSIFRATLLLNEKLFYYQSSAALVVFDGAFSNTVQKDLLTNNISSITSCGTNCYDIAYISSDVKRISIDRDNDLVKFGSYVDRLPANASFTGDMTVTNESFGGVAAGRNNALLKIYIPIDSDVVEGNFDINIVYQYDNRITSSMSSGLLADLPLGDYMTGNIYLDQSGSGNTGTNTNTTLVTDRFNINDKATSINNGQYISMGSLGITNAYSISFWIRPDQLTGGNADQTNYGFTLMASSPDATGYGIWLTAKNSELRINTWETTATFTDTVGANLVVNNWYHVVVTSTRGGNTSVRVNTTPVLSYTNTGASGWKNIFTIGDLRPGRNINYIGRISDLKIYNRVLTVSEIFALYNLSS